MDYITINGKSIPYPNDFQMKKVPNKVATLTTMSGRTISDINGWKYDDTTLSWDTLIEGDLNNLLSAISDNEFQMTFADIDGNHTVTAVLESRVNTKTRFKQNGQIVWKDISVVISFPDCYQ